MFFDIWKVFVFVVTITYITAEIPSYIHVCGRKDPNYDQCIAENIENVKHKICTGFSEFNIPPNEPLIFDKIVIFDTNDIKFYLKNLHLYGFCDFIVNSVQTNPERLHFDTDILLRQLYFNATYDFDIRLLARVANKGPIETVIASYIHVCGRRDPNLDKCIIDSIDNLKDFICKGIPELNSPPLVPFFMKQIIISETDNAKLYLKDAEITGLCDFTINSFHIDVDKLHFNMDLSFKHVCLNGTYDFDIKVLLPFVQKGPVYLTTDDVGAKIEVDMKLVTKNDKKYVYLSKINLKLELKKLNYIFDMNEKQSTQLNEINRNFFGSNEEFISKVKPSIEAEVSKQILILANNIVKQFTFDEFFPNQA